MYREPAQGVQYGTNENPYGGDEFDHLIEAQSAVLYDWMSIPYEYRKLAFGQGLYDRQVAPFFLPEQNYLVFFEDDEPRRDWDSLHMTIHVFGTAPMVPEDDPVDIDEDPDNIDPHIWRECPDCGRIGLVSEGRTDYLPCKKMGSLPGDRHDPRTPCQKDGDDRGERPHTESPKLVAAYQAAIDFGKMWKATHPNANAAHEMPASEPVKD